MKPQKKHHFKQIMNITQRYDKNRKHTITKPESNTRHCRDQEVAQGSDKQNSTAKRTNNRGKTFVVEESLSKNKQHSCKAKKQEVEQQEHRTVQNQEKHQGLSYELDLLKKMRIHSVFHAFMLQCCNQFIPLQTIETSVEPEQRISS
jgi:hypothetical protein